MNKPIIHFAHANGFPAKTYNKLFSYLENDFDIGFLERHAHNPKFPVTDGWKTLADELKEEIKKRYEEPIIGMGHSFGGVIHLMLAFQNPELYKAVVLLDAMVISRLSSFGIKVLKKTNLMKRLSPADAARLRRNTFDSKKEAFEHFRKKEKFAKFDREVLQDYINHGLVEANGEFKLFFNPQIEADIYQTIPDNLPTFKDRLITPTIYIGGTHSEEAFLARLSFMKKYFPIKFKFLEGSHLFPFEKPKKTSELIKDFLSTQKLIKSAL